MAGLCARNTRRFCLLHGKRIRRYKNRGKMRYAVKLYQTCVKHSKLVAGAHVSAFVFVVMGQKTSVALGDIVLVYRN